MKKKKKAKKLKALQTEALRVEIVHEAAVSAEKKDLNFKVAAEFHRVFKQAAIVRGLTAKAFEEQIFKTYLREHPHPNDLALDPKS